MEPPSSDTFSTNPSVDVDNIVPQIEKSSSSQKALVQVQAVWCIIILKDGRKERMVRMLMEVTPFPHQQCQWIIVKVPKNQIFFQEREGLNSNENEIGGKRAS